MSPNQNRQKKQQQDQKQSQQGGEQKKRPFQDVYFVNLSIAIWALVPFIILTTAFPLYEHLVGKNTGATRNALSVIEGIATAGYAFGAFLGGDIIMRLPQRLLFFLCESMLVAGCATASLAGGVVAFGAGMVLLAFATGLLLVVALPPVIQRNPASKMPITAAVVNVGFFGATSIGPLIGGAVAFGDAWRWLYGGLAIISALNLMVSFFTLPSTPPQKPDERFDSPAVVLAVFATVLPFLASGELAGHHLNSYWFMVPLAVGVACFVALLKAEYHQKNPLSPVKQMWHTVPLVGTLAAMLGGAAFITLLELAERYAMTAMHLSPLWTGIDTWPIVVGVLITALLLGIVVRTRLIPLLILSGMLCLVGAAILLMVNVHTNSITLFLAASGMLGLGAGATVSPGLWMAGFSLPSKMVGRTFALVELVRSETDFIVAPVILAVAQLWSGGGHLTAFGIRQGYWYTLLLTISATAFMATLFMLGGHRVHVPDLENWLQGSDPAIESSRILGLIRKKGKEG